jgi:hypothetical protein
MKVKQVFEVFGFRKTWLRRGVNGLGVRGMARITHPRFRTSNQVWLGKDALGV